MVEYGLSKHALAYMDILGYSEMVRDPHNLDDFFNRVKGFVRESSALARCLTCHSGLRIRIFSDNIVMSIQLNDNDVNASDAIDDLILISSYIQGYLLSELRLLCRGSIVVGQFYIDDEMVFGPALVEAYELESRIAIYPRIVLSEDACRCLKQHEQDCPFPELADGKRIIHDAGVMYIDLFEVIHRYVDDCHHYDIHSESGNYEDYYEMLRAKILGVGKGLMSVVNDMFSVGRSLDVVRKYIWLIERYNTTVLKDRADEYSIDYNIEREGPKYRLHVFNDNLECTPLNFDMEFYEPPYYDDRD